MDSLDALELKPITEIKISLQRSSNIKEWKKKTGNEDYLIRSSSLKKRKR